WSNCAGLNIVGRPNRLDQPGCLAHKAVVAARFFSYTLDIRLDVVPPLRDEWRDGRRSRPVIVREPLSQHVEIACFAGRASNFLEAPFNPTEPLWRQPFAIELKRRTRTPRAHTEPVDMLRILLGMVRSQRQVVSDGR
ncbi:MAG TPA: hypothetical protein VJ828_12090, partial [Lacipirellulaceae bacterium]|nr:hypothetical protein [Lacipirellulaceae bacterium]